MIPTSRWSSRWQPRIELTLGSALDFFILFVTGIAASIFGSLVGLGGGFLIVPVLRILLGVSPAGASGDSLVFVLANTTAASVTFLRRGAVDVGRGWMIAAGGIPASILGAYAVRFVTPRSFDTIYGAFLIALAITVILRRDHSPKPREIQPRAKIYLELAAGVAVGFFSSFFGIGGGIVLVPILLIYFGLPVHAVAATSAFAVMLTSPAGIIAHALYGDLSLAVAVPLVVGGLVGGAIGAHLAPRVSSRGLSSLLASGLILAALALIVRHLL